MVDFQKRGRGRPVDLKPIHLSPFYKTAREISKVTFCDLMHLLSYVPPVHHRFNHLLEL